VVPHIIIRTAHLELGKFVSHAAKRVLQHNPSMNWHQQLGLRHSKPTEREAWVAAQTCGQTDIPFVRALFFVTMRAR
jgi:hypothetical protein